MRVLKEAKIRVTDFTKHDKKVILNADKPCNERDLSCSSNSQYAPPR